MLKNAAVFTFALACAGADGEDGVAGPQGEPGEDGINGISGEQGPQGDQGPTGAPGTNAADFLRISSQIAPLDESLVMIVCCDSEGLVCAGGSGAKTSGSRVTTAKHVLEGMATCDVYSGRPIAFVASTYVFGSHPTLDIGQLTISVPGPAVDTLHNYAPTLGEPIVVVGHPGIGDGYSALENQYTFGYVTSATLFDTLGLTPEWYGAFSVDAVAWHGNSGGCAFNAEGSCVGLLVGGFNGADVNNGPDTNIVLPFPGNFVP